MIKKIHKGAVLMMLLFGLLFVTAAPGAMAQGRSRRCRDNQSSFVNRYDGNRRYDRSYDRGYDRGYDRRYDRGYYDDRYDDREDTTGRAVRRTAIGGGIGAVAGALIGGGKGALIGGGAGAAAGYIYHRKKVDDQRDRYGRRY